jgi:putative ABC transport system permease protein
MITNYARTAWRTLLKNRVFSLINIMGLAAGIAAFLFITTYVRFEQSYERFIPQSENIWRITLDLYNGSEYVVTDCETHAPMAGILKSRFPEVVDYVRMFNVDGVRTIEHGDKKFLETGVYFADPSVFNILGVEVLNGDPTKALTEPWQTAISQAQAIRLFGTTDAVGETLRIDGNDYNVTCVFSDREPNTHLKFSFLMSHATVPKTRSWYGDDRWNGNNEYTYLLMKPGADLAGFNQKLLAVSEEFKTNLSNGKYVAEPMTSIHLYSNKTFEPEANGNIKVVSFLSIVAIFIIVIAWVNYMNLATARAVERAKEVGIRKVLGSVRLQLIMQFLTESLIVNTIAGTCGLVAFELGLPWFKELTSLPSSVGSINWYLLSALVLVGTLLSGVYPAFVLSSFRPALVLKGKFQSSAHGQLLRKVLVVFQFGATIVLIVGVSVVHLQVNHLRAVDIGADLEQKIALRTPWLNVDQPTYLSKVKTFKNEVTKGSDVLSISACFSFPGIPVTEMSTTTIAVKGKESISGRYEYYWYQVDEDFVPTLGMTVVAGRNFDGISDAGNILINEEAANRLGFSKPEDAIGVETTFVAEWATDKPARIIGVIRNFYQRSPKEVHLPMLFPYFERGGYFVISTKTTDVSQTIAEVKKSWEKMFPGNIFNYTFLDEKYDQQYRADVQFGDVMGTFSALAVVIACLGLFGLSSYTIVQRRKEIGIRKVLGASIAQIVRLLSGSYMKIVLLSSVVAIPIAWLAVENWLSGYTTRIGLTVWIFVIPVIIIMATALLTVGFQTIKSAMANPADSLQQE